MLSRGERTAWAVATVLVLAGAGAAWLTREVWWPEAGPWLEQIWRKSTRPGPETLPAAKRPAAPGKAGEQAASPVPPRKCLASDGRVVYTDQACPPGLREQAVDGAVTVLPAPSGMPRQ